MYKVVYNDMIIDVLENASFVRYLTKSRRFINTDESSANGLVSSDGSTIYHLVNKPEFPAENTKSVKLVEIPEEEYLNLVSQLEKSDHEEIPDTTEEDKIKILEKQINNLIDRVDYLDPNGSDTSPAQDLSTAITRKLRQLSDNCNKAIINGFEVTLSDGKEYHFDLTIEDQINLASLTLLAAQGVRAIPYHASGELCKFYSAKDINLIVDKASELKTYHTTYYNSLKNYVKSLKTIKEVEAVQYGDSIPEEFWSDVMLYLVGGTIS